METFSMPFEQVLWRIDWKNITLLLKDKLRYVGKENKQEKETEMTLEEEIRYFNSLQNV